MTTKRFFALCFVALLTFAAFVAGGCGGSSSDLANISDNDTPTNPDTITAQMPSILEALQSLEFSIVNQELTNELAGDGRNAAGLTQQIHYVGVTSSGEIVVWENAANVPAGVLQNSSEPALTESQINELSAKIKQYYDSGDVIATFSGSPAFLDSIYQAVGEPPLYNSVEGVLSNSASEDIAPEMYAFAQRYDDNEVKYTFSYIIPHNSSNMLQDVVEGIASSDVAAAADLENYINASDGEDGTEEDKYAGLREEYVFQAQRFANFQSWAMDIDAQMEEQQMYTASSKFPLRSAEFSNESKSGEMFSYGAQKITVDVSYKSPNVSYLKFSAAANYTVYSFYDFGDKNEYYYVQANCFIKPEGYKKYTDSQAKKTDGSMCWYNFWHTIDGATYNLFSHAPKNVNRSRSLNDGTNYSTTNTTGYKVGTEVGAEISTEGAKISTKVTSEYSSSTSKSTGYNHSATWTANDWAIIDESDTATPSWKVDFKAPDYNSGGPDGYYPEWNGNVADATTQRNDLDSEWMWQVTKSSKNIAIRTHLKARIRETGVYFSDGGRAYSSYTPKNAAVAPIAKPPHIIVKQKNFDFGKVGGLAGFRLICGGNWQAVSDSDWCQVAPSSGEATAGEEQSVFIRAKTFDTGTDDLEVRQAKIMVKDLDTGQIQTLKIAQNNW